MPRVFRSVNDGDPEFKPGSEQRSILPEGSAGYKKYVSLVNQRLQQLQKKLPQSDQYLAFKVNMLPNGYKVVETDDERRYVYVHRGLIISSAKNLAVHLVNHRRPLEDDEERKCDCHDCNPKSTS